MHSTTELYRPPPLISFWWVLIKTILVIDNRNHFRLSKAEKRIYIIDTEYPRAESLVKFEERLNFGVGQLAGTEAGCSLSHAEDTQSCMCSFFSLHICLFFCFSLFLSLCRPVFSASPYMCQKMASTGCITLLCWQIDKHFSFKSLGQGACLAQFGSGRWLSV